MATTYRKLCQVRMRHDYFTSGALTGLVAAPTPATATCLRRAGLLFRAEPDGFTLLYTNTKPYTPLAKLQGLFPLAFGLTATDPYFANYTNLPMLPVGSDTTYCLRPAPNSPLGPIGAAELLPLRPLMFSLPLQVPHPALRVQLSCPPGLGPTWQVPANAPAVSLDSRPWGSGYYQLLFNDQATFPFYADDFLYRTQPWGLLEIGAAVLAAAPALEPPVFTLVFEARATYWQYQLTARHPPLPDLCIGNASTVKFSLVPSGPGIAASYQARQTIKFAQRYTLAPFQLSILADQFNTAPRVLLPALPQASPSGLRIDGSSVTPRYVSDIFVQV